MLKLWHTKRKQGTFPLSSGHTVEATLVPVNYLSVQCLAFLVPSLHRWVLFRMLVEVYVDPIKSYRSHILFSETHSQSDRTHAFQSIIKRVLEIVR